MAAADLRKARGIGFLVLLAPGLLVFALFTIYPLAKLLAMSFFDWRIGLAQRSIFVGLENYRAVLRDPVFALVAANTALYALVTVPLQIAAGLTVAVLIQSLARGRVFFRLMYYLPVITSWVIVSLVFKYLFFTEGYLNHVITDSLGLAAERIRWLDNRFTAMSAVSILGIWKGVGWNMVVFLAALQAVPTELYEVAALDGCGRTASFFRITLPSIRTTVFFALVMLTIGAFNVFTSIKLMTDGRPAHQTEVVLTWMYFRAFEARQFGYAAALSWAVALVITAITVAEFGFFSRPRS